MSFDFMKDLVFWEDEERFLRLCENLDALIREAQAEAGEKEMTELEMMQALDQVGFNMFRDNWEEFKKMSFDRDLGTYGVSSKNRSSHIH
ncbi:MAG: hypothetical protein KC553_06630 [Nitrospina sp.]|nr:hypothetical protein [Nitrospina sp.]